MTPTSSSRTLICPAKVNLALSVGPPRSDGMHDIASWMVALDFGDTLTVRRASGDASSWQVVAADDAPVRQQIDWPLEKDLAWRAHRLLEAYLGQPLPVAVKLAKRVPAGAGLGGGSSDAAGILVALDSLFDLNLSPATLADLAGEVGSDVTFLVAAMRGSPSAIVTGTGDVIELSPLARTIHLLLICPPFGCPTAPVYEAFDAEHGDDAALRASAVRQLAAAPLAGGALFNDLAEPAEQVQPRLRDARRAAQRVIDLPVHVTGSGAAMFAVAESKQHAHSLAEAITADTGMAALAAGSLTVA